MNAVNAATVTTGTHDDGAGNTEVDVVEDLHPGSGSGLSDAADPTDRVSERTAVPHRPVELDGPVHELARQAAGQDAGGAGHVGDFLTAETEDDVAVTVRFRATDAAYNGWAWCVTLALVDPAAPTVSEVVLLPGPDAVLPPRWLPWNERVRPGDLGPGDLMLPIADDARLVPAYLESDDPAVEDVAHELGIGRPRVMSRPGRTDTAERWHEGTFGPDSEMAKAAPAVCVMCAFYLPLGGSLGAQFGACGNEMSPADGRVVDAAYGCGAHSEIVIEPVPTGFRESHIDDLVLDVHPRPLSAAGPAEFLSDSDQDLEFVPVHPHAAVEPAAATAELVAAEPESPATDPDPDPVAEFAPEAVSAVVAEEPEPEPAPADSAADESAEPDEPEESDEPAESDEPSEPAESVVVESEPASDPEPAELEIEPGAGDQPAELEIEPSLFTADPVEVPADASDESDA